MLDNECNYLSMALLTNFLWAWQSITNGYSSEPVCIKDTHFWKKLHQLDQFYIGNNISLMFLFILFTGAEYDESFHTISSLVEWHNMSSTLIPHLIFLNIRQFVWRLELITELQKHFTNNKLRYKWFTVNCRHSAVMRRVLLLGCLFHLLYCHFQLEYNCWCFW